MANIVSNEIEGTQAMVENSFEILIHASLPESPEAGMALSVNHLKGDGEG